MMIVTYHVVSSVTHLASQHPTNELFRWRRKADKRSERVKGAWWGDQVEKIARLQLCVVSMKLEWNYFLQLFCSETNYIVISTMFSLVLVFWILNSLDLYTKWNFNFISLLSSWSFFCFVVFGAFLELSMFFVIFNFNKTLLLHRIVRPSIIGNCSFCLFVLLSALVFRHS